MKKLFLVLLCLTNFSACSGDKPEPVAVVDQSDQAVILVVGDSLSAGYGIDVDQGWVNLLRQRLIAESLNYNVVNASVSGDTTSGGLTRLRAVLPRLKPAIVVIELGGNDGLRAIQLTVIKSNLNSMIKLSRESGARVVLLGMRIPANYGRRYSQQFAALYDEAAAKHDLPLVEFFLEGVALDPSLMQADGVHPNAAAQTKLLDNAWPAIESALSAK